MNFDHTAFEHTLNQLSRDVQDIFDEYSVLFVPYVSGQRERALGQKLQDIEKRTFHDQGFINHLVKTLDSSVLKIVRKPLLHVFTKTTYLAVVFVNMDTDQASRLQIFEEETQDSTLFVAASSVGKGLMLCSLAKKNTDPHIVKNGHIFSFKNSSEGAAKKNLIGDCFAAMYLELKGRKSVISDIQKARAKLCFEKSIDYAPELYPTPITLDSLKMVLHSAEQNEFAREPIEKAFYATEEISEVYDAITVEKWLEFSTKTQEMIWADQSVSNALGTAAYSAEDAYIRSFASIMADLLNKDIAPVKMGNNYNPFALTEDTESIHLKQASKTFASLIDKVISTDAAELFLSEAHKQNEHLLNGYIMGWCAPALISAHAAFQDIEDENQNRAELAHTKFYETLNATPWEHISSLSRLSMYLNRTAQPTVSALKKRIKDDGALSYLFKYF